MRLRPRARSRHLAEWAVGFWLCLGLLPTGSAAAQDLNGDLHRGKAVYEQYCQRCHGPKGQGDGPEATWLKVPPANFQRASSYLKSDEDLLRTIEFGVVFTPMHSWTGRVSEGQREDVVAYIRTFAQHHP